jgi:hypothetical protein
MMGGFFFFFLYEIFPKYKEENHFRESDRSVLREENVCSITLFFFLETLAQLSR